MDGQFVDKQSKIQMDLVVLREQKSPTWSWDSLVTSVFFCAEQNTKTWSYEPAHADHSQHQTRGQQYPGSFREGEPRSILRVIRNRRELITRSLELEHTDNSQHQARGQQWPGLYEYMSEYRLLLLHDFTGRITTTSSPEHMPARLAPTTG